MAADAGHLAEFLDARAADSVQAAEVLQQLPAAFWTEAGDVFERRALAPFGPAATMTGDRETVGFVAYLLHQVQRR